MSICWYWLSRNFNNSLSGIKVILGEPYNNQSKSGFIFPLSCSSTISVFVWTVEQSCNLLCVYILSVYPHHWSTKIELRKAQALHIYWHKIEILAKLYLFPVGSIYLFSKESQWYHLKQKISLKKTIFNDWSLNSSVFYFCYSSWMVHP